MVGNARSFRGNSRWLLLSVMLLLLIGLVWGLAGAFGSSSSPSPAAGKVILRVGWVNDPDNLNPFIGYESSSFEIWHLNYDMLVGYKASDGSPAPELAESWETSSDGKTWTFHLRHGISWQDGVPFTASDVAFTFNYIVDNATDLAAMSAYTNLIKHVNVVDPYTVEFVCSKPKANMLRMWVPVLPEHIWSKVPAKDAGSKYQNKPPIIGTGPFQTVEVKKGEFVRMEANPHYWRAKPTIQEILFQTYTNADTMAQELKAGTLDVAYSIPSAQFKQIGATPGLKAIEYNTKAWEYLDFNCYNDPASLGNPVLKDVKFRQAVSWAIDRQKLCDLAWNGHATPGTTMMPPDVWPANWNAHYEPTAAEKFGFDLNKAKAMLDAAGYKDTNGDGIRDYKGKPIKLRLWARSESTSSQTEGKLIAGWFSDLGLKIDYQVMDDGVISEKLYNATNGGNTYAPDFDMYIWDWVGYADPGDTLVSFTTDQIWMWNDTNWSNKEYDTLAVAQQSEMDPAKRLAMIHRMQEIFYVDAPEVILDYPKDLEAYNVDKWQGWVRYNGGAVIYSNDNIDSYLFLKPMEKAASSNSSTLLTAGIVIAAVLVIGIVGFVMMRRRPHAVEE